MIYEDPDADAFMNVPTEEVLAKLQESPEGRMHLQIAMQAVVIKQLRQEIEALSISPEPKDDDDK